LTERGVGSAVYYPTPLHLQPCFASLGYARGSLPETERASEQVLSLPIYPELDVKEQHAVVAAFGEFFARRAASDRHVIRQPPGSLVRLAS
jgi:dTDP-4-amino-4,6-dideoxygalactose transaminase